MTVMLEQDSEVPRRRNHVALLSTEDSNDSKKHRCTVLTIHLTLAYPLLHISNCPFLVSAQRMSDK